MFVSLLTEKLWVDFCEIGGKHELWTKEELVKFLNLKHSYVDIYSCVVV